MKCNEYLIAQSRYVTFTLLLTLTPCFYDSFCLFSSHLNTAAFNMMNTLAMQNQSHPYPQTYPYPYWYPPHQNHLGMISHKMSLITIFGHKHKILNFIKNLEIFHKKFEKFHKKFLKFH